MSKVQLVINRGILEEDPDGVLYLSAKIKDIIADVEGSETLMAAIKKKAIDEADAQTGFWTLVFMKHCGETSSDEINDGVHALMSWHRGARENRLNEWSMRLRLRETKV